MKQLNNKTKLLSMSLIALSGIAFYTTINAQTYSMTCLDYLSQDRYQTHSLGIRNTPCGAGYTSMATQKGEQSWSCPDPYANRLPVGTNTWWGGACAVTSQLNQFGPIKYSTFNNDVEEMSPVILSSDNNKYRNVDPINDFQSQGY
jgi:hypothetical protein